MKDKELVVASPFSFDVQQIISQAVEKGTGVEVMRELYAMRNEMKKEAAKEAYNLALAAFQAACPTINKSKAVIIGGARRYSYAPLDDIISQVKGLLKESGFSYSFNAEFKEGAQIITCTARHEAGHSEIATFRAPTESNAGMSEVQKHGAALTFAKRYAFCQVFGIMTGDEDMDAGKEQEGSEPPKTQAKTYAPPPKTDPPKTDPETTKTKNFKFLQEMENCKKALVDMLGKEAGEGTYYNTLADGGYAHANEIAEKNRQVAAYRAMRNIIKEASRPKKSTAAEMGAEISKDMKEGYIAPKEGNLL